MDLGGATTDVYSIADGNPANVAMVMKGLQEPYAKRSVEGDIGMRYSVQGILEAAGDRKLSKISGINRQKIAGLVEYLGSHTDYIPDNEEMEHIDYALACAAVETAVTRHAGSLEQVYHPCGLTYVQSGQGFAAVKNVIVRAGFDTCKAYRGNCQIRSV